MRKSLKLQGWITKEQNDVSMYKKILVPLDGSPESEKALPRAAELLDPNQESVLFLLRVLEIPSVSSWTSTNLIRAHDEEEKAVQEYLDSVEVPGLPASATLDLVSHPGPSPAQAIADVAEEQGVDLIVMTCQGRSGFRQFLLGSQTEKTLRLAKGSVLVVREPHD